VAIQVEHKSAGSLSLWERAGVRETCEATGTALTLTLSPGEREWNSERDVPGQFSVSETNTNRNETSAGFLKGS